MKKQVAVLLDLGFVLYSLYRPLGSRHATAAEVAEFANSCVSDDEELFRIYCYHCPPYAKSKVHPLTRKPTHFKKEPTYAVMSQLIEELEVMDKVAFRSGEISFNGWKIKQRSADELIKTGRPLEPEDFQPDMKQKRVDIKIGLDVAWLSSKSIVDRIILASGDTDFIPAMKFARREGVQVVSATVSNRPTRDIQVHADEVRTILFPKK